MLNEIILKTGTQIYLKEKEVLFKENDFDNKIFYIQRGKVLLAKTLSNKKYYRMVINEKNFFGIFEAILKKFRMTNAISTTDTEIIYWDLDKFLLGISMHPEMAHLCINNLCQLLRRVNKRKEDLISSEKKIVIQSQSQVEDEELGKVLSDIAFSKDSTPITEAFDKVGVEFKNNEIIFNEGDKSDEIYIIVDGIVEIYINDEKGKKFIAKLYKDDFLGEMSHFDGEPRSATAKARGTVKLLKFTKENFNIIFQLHPKWTIKLLHTLSSRIYNTFELLFEKDEL
ncbi:MAG TPA: cyclic nucleotide-binding domain-containing protein [bacterium]|nr:cyclic nucleotide-binding domain-containing protein [bacterium]HOL46920.1 cyclic nucleotide-binding domain-containing protein [bacterium]HPQ18318.1 cyclic nucleotide-binding domain-containing protein [bacterium]